MPKHLLTAVWPREEGFCKGVSGGINLIKTLSHVNMILWVFIASANIQFGCPCQRLG